MRIYLDHNATTPLRPEVADAMDLVQRSVFGNPSSVHEEGAAARAECDRARARVASLLRVDPDDVLFTGGATEANNTAINAQCNCIVCIHSRPLGNSDIHFDVRQL